jgi:membrane associated rhomboid family serine protease
MTSAMLVALLLGLLCMATECAALNQVPRSGIFLLQQKSLRTPNALSRSLDTVRKQTQRLGSKISRNYGLQKSPRMQLTATNSLLIANIVAYLGTLAFPQLKYALMKVDNRILRGESYRLLSALFAHGSVSHLVMNCLSLSNIGPQVHS